MNEKFKILQKMPTEGHFVGIFKVHSPKMGEYLVTYSFYWDEGVLYEYDVIYNSWEKQQVEEVELAQCYLVMRDYVKYNFETLNKAITKGERYFFNANGVELTLDLETGLLSRDYMDPGRHIYECLEEGLGYFK